MARRPRKRKAPKGCFWRNGVLYAQVRINGRLYRTTLSTSDADEAAAQAKTWRERTIKEVRFGHLRPTFKKVYIEWERHIDENVSPNTAERYRVSFRQLAPFLEALYFDEIDRPLIGKIVAARRDAGVSSATLRRDLTALSSLLAFHDREDNPALSWLKKVSERRDPIVLPEPVDIERVIARAPGNFAHLIRAAWLTGCRQEELASAERRNLNLDRREFTIIGKGNKLRVIELSPAAFTLFRSLPPRLDCPWLFWHDDGQRYANVSARFALFVREVAEEARKKRREFRRFRFHDLRHRFAVEALRSGMSLYDLSDHLGHSSVKVTEIYLRFLTPEQARKAKHSISKKLSSQTEDVVSFRRKGE